MSAHNIDMPPRPSSPLTMHSVVSYIQRWLQIRNKLPHGVDSKNQTYQSLAQMWISMKVLDATTSPIISSSHPWYKTGETYWEDTGNCPPTIDGVLGGYAHISPHDISGSSQFLSKVSQLRPQMKFTTACDCGAGIGRVTRDLLLVRFSSFVTLVEVSERLCREAVPFVGDSGSSRIKVFNVGMQDFLPSAGSFDCIWIQVSERSAKKRASHEVTALTLRKIAVGCGPIDRFGSRRFSCEVWEWARKWGSPCH